MKFCGSIFALVLAGFMSSAFSALPLRRHSPISQVSTVRDNTLPGDERGAKYLMTDGLWFAKAKKAAN